MSSISVKAAESTYRGATREETIQNMATEGGYKRIYIYANDYGNKVTHTDYKRIKNPGDAQEQEFRNSRTVHNVVLVYDNGKPTNLDRIKV